MDLTTRHQNRHGHTLSLKKLTRALEYSNVRVIPPWRRGSIRAGPIRNRGRPSTCWKREASNPDGVPMILLKKRTEGAKSRKGRRFQLLRRKRKRSGIRQVQGETPTNSQCGGHIVHKRTGDGDSRRTGRTPTGPPNTTTWRTRHQYKTTKQGYNPKHVLYSPLKTRLGSCEKLVHLCNKWS